MTKVVSDGKSSLPSTKKLPKGTFLSTFLGYLMLNNGYSENKKFGYYAVAEEDGEVFNGQAIIKKRVKLDGIDSYRILNTFKGTKFVSFVTDRGEVISTKSPLQQIATQLTPSPAIATKGFPVPSRSLKMLFGKVPLGKINILAQRMAPSKKPSLDAGKLIPGKTKGLPAKAGTKAQKPSGSLKAPSGKLTPPKNEPAQPPAKPIKEN